MGPYFASLLEPRWRAERALLAVVQEAYVLGLSTRRVEDLVDALGIASLSKSEVSRICTALDAEIEAYRQGPLGVEPYPSADQEPASRGGNCPTSVVHACCPASELLASSFRTAPE